MESRPPRALTLSALLLVLLPWAAIAADEGLPDAPDAPDATKQPTPLRIEEELVVTASKYPRREEEITQRVDRIDEAAIAARPLPNRNLSELLAREPGAAVSVLSRNDANWGAYGSLGPKYNTYMLDGLPVDAFVDTMSLDAWAFESVERQRGAASVLYPTLLSSDFAGSQSPLAGTTNLLLRRRSPESRTRVELSGGSYDTLSGRLFTQGHGGPVHYFGGVSHERSDYTDYGRPGSWLHMIESPAYDKTRTYLGTTLVLDPAHEVFVFGQHTSHDGTAGRPNRDYAHDYDTVNAEYHGRFGEDLDARLRVGYRGHDRRWGEDNYNPPSSLDLTLRSHDGVRQRIVPADASVAWRHAGASVLTVGTDLQSTSYDTYSENGLRLVGNDATAKSNGFYAQEELLVGRLTLRVGGRIHHISNEYTTIAGGAPGEPNASWTRGLWNAGARFRLTSKASLFANAGTSFVPPAAKSVGGTLRPEDEGVPGRNGQLPSPGLRPEDGLAVDLGTQAQLGVGTSIGVRGFVTRVGDAIVENRVSTDPSQSRSVNAGRARTLGMELEARGRAAGRLSWYANVTLADTEVDNPLDQDQDGANVPFAPGVTANAGLTLDLPRSATLFADVQHVGAFHDSTSLSGRERLPAHTVVSLAGSYPLTTRDRFGASVRAEVYNVFDERFDMPWQFRDPGRRGTLSLLLAF